MKQDQSEKLDHDEWENKLFELKNFFITSPPFASLYNKRLKALKALHQVGSVNSVNVGLPQLPPLPKSGAELVRLYTELERLFKLKMSQSWNPKEIGVWVEFWLQTSLILETEILNQIQRLGIVIPNQDVKVGQSIDWFQLSTVFSNQNLSEEQIVEIVRLDRKNKLRQNERIPKDKFDN